MNDTPRDRYLSTLLALAEKHNGPLSDLAPVLERCDLLTGLELAPKQLTGGTPAIEGSTPDVKHGSGQQAGDGASVARSSGVSAGARHMEGFATPDPLPVEHEEPQQVDHSDRPLPNVSQGVANAPAAPSPSFDRRDPSPGPRSLKERRKCDCGCGTELTVWPYERRAKPDGPFYLNRAHAALGRRQRNAEARRQSEPATPLQNIEALSAEVEQDLPTEVNTPARGLAAITKMSPVEALPLSVTKFCARCNGRMSYERANSGDEWTCMTCGNVSYGPTFEPLADEEPGARGASHAGSRI